MSVKSYINNEMNFYVNLAASSKEALAHSIVLRDELFNYGIFSRIDPGSYVEIPELDVFIYYLDDSVLRLFKRYYGNGPKERNYLFGYSPKSMAIPNSVLYNDTMPADIAKKVFEITGKQEIPNGCALVSPTSFEKKIKDLNANGADISHGIELALQILTSLGYSEGVALIRKKMIEIEFTDSFVDENSTTVLYFNVPMSYLTSKYDDACGAEIRLELGDNLNVDAFISPVSFDEEADQFVSYDWKPYQLSEFLKAKLLTLYFSRKTK